VCTLCSYAHVSRHSLAGSVTKVSSAMEQHPDGLGQWAGVRSDPPPHMRSPAVLDPQNRDPHSAVDKPAPLVDISPQDISMAFDRSQSAISRLCTAIDRGDIKLLQPLRAALVDLLALSTIFKVE